MNDKKKIIRLWSLILLGTIICNIIFWILAIDSGIIWLIIVAYSLIVWDVFAIIFWIRSFNVKYKKFTIESSEIEIYAGLSNHYLKVNGELKDEYKSNRVFSSIKLSCLLNDKKLTVTISTSNHIVVKFNDELIKS